MFIYNMTIKIDWAIHDDWLQWMVNEQIPEMLASSYFYKHQMVRLLEVDEEEGPTYAIQLHAHNKQDYMKFISHLSPLLAEKARKKWADRFIFFGTLMEVVN